MRSDTWTFPTSRFAAPPAERLYIVGDIHGRLDLLETMIGLIKQDQRSAEDVTCRTIFLGDYVDRGPESHGVIDLLAGDNTGLVNVSCLRGNHEQALLDFLDGREGCENWLIFGGLATLQSYGVRADETALSDQHVLRQTIRAARQAIPEKHETFLRDLPLWMRFGDLLCVHAGINPGVPLESQQKRDLLWIRDTFLEDNRDHGLRVIHGHTISEAPSIHDNRIGIDTGAYASGQLTCLVAQDRRTRFLTT